MKTSIFSCFALAVACFSLGVAVSNYWVVFYPPQAFFYMPAENMNKTLYEDLLRSGYACGKYSSQGDGREDRIVCWDRKSTSKYIPARERRLY